MKYKKTVILTSSDDEMDHVTVSNMNADIFTVTETVNTVRTIEPKQGQVLINNCLYKFPSNLIYSFYISWVMKYKYRKMS